MEEAGWRGGAAWPPEIRVIPRWHRWRLPRRLSPHRLIRLSNGSSRLRTYRRLLRMISQIITRMLMFHCPTVAFPEPLPDYKNIFGPRSPIRAPLWQMVPPSASAGRMQIVHLNIDSLSVTSGAVGRSPLGYHYLIEARTWPNFRFYGFVFYYVVCYEISQLIDKFITFIIINKY